MGTAGDTDPPRRACGTRRRRRGGVSWAPVGLSVGVGSPIWEPAATRRWRRDGGDATGRDAVPIQHAGCASSRSSVPVERKKRRRASDERHAARQLPSSFVTGDNLLRSCVDRRSVFDGISQKEVPDSSRRESEDREERRRGKKGEGETI